MRINGYLNEMEGIVFKYSFLCFNDIKEVISYFLSQECQTKHNPAIRVIKKCISFIWSEIMGELLISKYTSKT